MFRVIVAAVACSLGAGAAQAQPSGVPSPSPRLLYGEPLSFDMASKVAAAAEAQAAATFRYVAVAVVDSGGNLVLLHRLDQAQLSAARLAEGKARTAIEFRRPTGAVQDAVTAGGAGNWWLGVPGVVALEGGISIVVEGKIVGAVGVSGGVPAQDAVTAQAGADALK